MRYYDFPKKLVLRVFGSLCPSCLLHLEHIEEIQLASTMGLVNGIPDEVDAVGATEEDFWRDLYNSLPILEVAEE
jgi:hypothetical protein